MGRTITHGLDVTPVRALTLCCCLPRCRRFYLQNLTPQQVLEKLPSLEALLGVLQSAALAASGGAPVRLTVTIVATEEGGFQAPHPDWHDIEKG